MTIQCLIRLLALISMMTGLNRGVTCLPAFSLDGPLNLENAILLQPVEMEELRDREERGVSSGAGPEVPPGLADDEDMVTTPVQKKPEVLKLAVLSRVTARFASTEVRSKLKNVRRKAAEASFTIKLPVDAFITAFSMTIEDVVYHSEVKPKEQAQKAYDAAKAKGQTAGQVKQSSPEESKFTVSVTVSAKTSVLFNLTYQQLLKRKEGRFENSISIQPGQNVPDIRVEVHVTEPQGLAWLNTTWRLGDESDERKLDNMTSVDLRDRSAKVLFDTRGEGALTSRNGIMGDFIVHYDVMHDDKAGRLEIVEGYFVHYFSPSGLPKARKNVVFVVDTSGSMNGLKIRQTKQALTTILDDVRPIDKFNIVFFESDINVWRDGEMVEATPNNIDRAQSFVDRIRATGGTNIYDALMKAVELLTTNGFDEAFPLIIMLTDGEPTSGPFTNTADIISRVTATIEGRVSLFSLGFGSGVDYNFLEKLSLSNNALARKIYTDSSASIQVKGFYDEVANPLLFDINIKYDDQLIDSESLTKSTFKAYFDGTEITVAGKLKDDVIYNVWDTGNITERGSSVQAGSNELELGVAISARSFDLDFEFNTSTLIETDRPLRKREVESFTKRLWAYLTIKNLLDQRKTATNKQIKNSLTERALNLSLDFHFVTPLTSLLVVRPDDPAGNTTTIDGEQQPIEEEKGEDALASIPVGQRRGPFTGAPGLGVAPSQGSKVAGPSQTHKQMYRPTAVADSDPHFMIEIPNTDVNVCFDINGDPGDVFILLSDPEIGLLVSAETIAAPNGRPVASAREHNDTHPPTFFGKVVVHLGPARTLFVTPEGITLDGGVLELHWGEGGVAIRVGEFVLTLDGKRQLVISRGDNIVVAVMLHRSGVGEKRALLRHSHRVDHLGFYIQDGRGFSCNVHGLVGQFQRQTDLLVSIHSDITEDDTDQLSAPTATISIADRTVAVTRKKRRIPLTRDYRDCWHAANNAQGLIEGDYTNYKLQNLYAYPLTWK